MVSLLQSRLILKINVVTVNLIVLFPLIILKYHLKNFIPANPTIYVELLFIPRI